MTFQLIRWECHFFPVSPFPLLVFVLPMTDWNQCNLGNFLSHDPLCLNDGFGCTFPGKGESYQGDRSISEYHFSETEGRDVDRILSGRYDFFIDFSALIFWLPVCCLLQLNLNHLVTPVSKLNKQLTCILSTKSWSSFGNYFKCSFVLERSEQFSLYNRLGWDMAILWIKTMFPIVWIVISCDQIKYFDSLGENKILHFRGGSFYALWLA